MALKSEIQQTPNGGSNSVDPESQLDEDLEDGEIIEEDFEEEGEEEPKSKNENFHSGGNRHFEKDNRRFDSKSTFNSHGDPVLSEKRGKNNFKKAYEMWIDKPFNKEKSKKSFDEIRDDEFRSKKKRKKPHKEEGSPKRLKKQRSGSDKHMRNGEGGENDDDDEMLFIRGASPFGDHGRNSSSTNFDETDDLGDEEEEIGESSTGRGGGISGRGSFSNRRGRGADRRTRPPLRGAGKRRGRGGGPGPMRKGKHKDENSESVCIFYMQGKCHRGDDCPYSHDANPPKKMELCKFYLMDCCAKRDKCLYMHNDFPCKYYHTNLKCFAAKNCKFSHGKLNDQLRTILIKHIETAPKEILGEFPRIGREGAIAFLKSGGRRDNNIPSLLEMNLSVPDDGRQQSDQQSNTPIPSPTGPSDQEPSSNENFDEKFGHNKFSDDKYGNKAKSKSKKDRKSKSSRREEKHHRREEKKLDKERHRKEERERDREKEEKKSYKHNEELNHRRGFEERTNMYDQCYDTQYDGQYNQQSNKPFNQQYNTPYNQQYNSPYDQHFSAPYDQQYNMPPEKSNNEYVDKKFNSNNSCDQSFDQSGVSSGSERLEINEDKKMKEEEMDQDTEREKETEESQDTKGTNETKDDKPDEKDEILNHLPKKQRELFLRIQQHQRDSSIETEETSVEMEPKVEENWYSSDEEEEKEVEEKPTPLSAILRTLQQLQPSANSTQPSNSPQASTPEESVQSVSQEAPQQFSMQQSSPQNQPPPLVIPSQFANINISDEVTKLLSTIRSQTEEKKNEQPKVQPSSQPQQTQPKLPAQPSLSHPNIPMVRDPRLRADNPFLQPPQSAVKKEIHTPINIPLRRQTGEGENTNISLMDIDLRLPNPEVPAESPASIGAGDVDLRHLPFKPAPIHQAATEIDASISSHPPIPFKLISIFVPKIDYTNVVSSTKGGLKDPRLCRPEKTPMQISNADNTSSLTPPHQTLMQQHAPIAGVRDPRKLNAASNDPRGPMADPRLSNSDADVRQPRMDPRMDPRQRPGLMGAIPDPRSRLMPQQPMAPTMMNTPMYDEDSRNFNPNFNMMPNVYNMDSDLRQMMNPMQCQPGMRPYDEDQFSGGPRMQDARGPRVDPRKMRDDMRQQQFGFPPNQSFDGDVDLRMNQMPPRYKYSK